MTRLKVAILSFFLFGIIMIGGCESSTDEQKLQNEMQSVNETITNPTISSSNEANDTSNYYKINYDKAEQKDGCWLYIDKIWLPMYNELEVGVIDLYSIEVDNIVKNQGTINSVSGLSTREIAGSLGGNLISKARFYDETMPETKGDTIILATYPDEGVYNDTEALCLTFALYEMSPEDYSPVNIEVYSCDVSIDIRKEKENIDTYIADGTVVKLNEKKITKSGKLYIDVDGFRKSNENKRIFILARSEKDNSDITRLIVEYYYKIDNRNLFEDWMNANPDIVIR